MDKHEALNKLADKSVDILEVANIFNTFLDDIEIESSVAMNLSVRTSVYDRELGKSDIMQDLLIKLSNSKDMGVRWAVAKNPHTPVDILVKLSTDSVNLVRALVATNPNTPVEVLVPFFSDEKIVRDGLSGNPNTPLKFLNILSDDSDKMVRLRVAENPSSSREILEKLSNDTEKDVQKAATIQLNNRGLS
ncbi:MAG: hypothetical protein HXX81_07600 [Campylobacterales bacterium]|nr:hypothetical protein [Campylobacterales bacterium]